MAATWECRDLWNNGYTGTMPTELGNLNALQYLQVSDNGLTGTLPTELGTLTALTLLCVHRPHPPRLHACAVTGLWAVGAQ